MEMVHGEPPNSSTHPMKVLFLIPKAPAPRLEGNNYSREFKDFVKSCLVKDPDRRPTARELLQHKFVKNAGKVEALQELVQRRQMWDGGRGKISHPKYYEETMNTMSPMEEKDDWVFDTVKASTISIHQTQKRRKTSATSTTITESPEHLFSKLTLVDGPSEQDQEQRSTPQTMRKTISKRHASPSQILSPAKRRTSSQRKPSDQRKPLAPDMSFGNSASTVRLFRRVSDNSPSASPNLSLAERDENRPPTVETVTKEALLGRRAYSKVVDQAFQEVYAQTGNQVRREALSRAAQAWNDLDMDDPEGEFQLLRLVVEKIQAWVWYPSICGAYADMDFPAIRNSQRPSYPDLNPPRPKSRNSSSRRIIPI